MKVIKRNKTKEEVNPNKIMRRIKNLSRGLSNVDPILISKEVFSGLFEGVTTRELDQLAISVASNLSMTHTDYDTLAARLCVNNLHKETDSEFSTVMEKLYNRKDFKGDHKPVLSEEFIRIVRKHKKIIDAEIVYKRDYDFDFLGIATLLHRYLLKINGEVVERPQHMWMRVAIAIHGEDIPSVFDTYEKMSKKMMIHATPTLFNAGTVRSQYVSCFLLSVDEDSIIGDDYSETGEPKGIYKTINDCAALSKMAGGIGVHIHKIRSSGAPIYGTGQVSDGVVPMLKVFNETACYVNQGGRRKGSFAFYLSVHHADIYSYLDLRRNTGANEKRARDLFYAVWVPDLFMDRVREDGDWTLMDPMLCPGLDDVYGEEFKNLYEKYERESLGSRTVKARHLYRKIISIQIETAMPYVLYKDKVNKKTNQSNIGTIQSSNLCAEITEYSDKNEVASCNLASISLPYYVEGDKRTRFNHKKLHGVVKQAIRNLNKVIDLNDYPVKESKTSNFRHRPVGLGVQGLADVFCRMKINWDSKEAFKLNQEIFETIYHASMESSCEIAMEEGPYSTFEGSPASKGIFQYDMWFEDLKENWEKVKDNLFFNWGNPFEASSAEEYYCSKRYDWISLKEAVKKHGIRNSLLVALMPTASTASILGNTESFEPIPNNFYKRHVLSGEFIRSNKYLIKELDSLGLWNDIMRQRILAAEGSVQNISKIPKEVRKLFRTVWELPQKVIMELSARRGAFVCQSQSLNIYMKKPTIRALSSCHMFGNDIGLKTSMYYLRSQSAKQAQKFTVSVEIEEEFLKDEKKYNDALRILLEKGFEEEDLRKWDRKDVIDAASDSCSLDNPDGDCLMCGS